MILWCGILCCVHLGLGSASRPLTSRYMPSSRGYYCLYNGAHEPSSTGKKYSCYAQTWGLRLLHIRGLLFRHRFCNSSSMFFSIFSHSAINSKGRPIGHPAANIAYVAAAVYVHCTGRVSVPVPDLKHIATVFESERI